MGRVWGMKGVTTSILDDMSDPYTGSGLRMRPGAIGGQFRHVTT